MVPLKVCARSSGKPLEPRAGASSGGGRAAPGGPVLGDLAPSRHVEAGKDEGRAGTSKGKSGMLKPGRLFFLRCWLLGVDSHFFPPQPRWAGGFGEANHARQGCDLLCCSHSGAELAETQILRLGVSFCSDPAVARGCAQRGSCLRNGVRKSQTRICCCTEPLPAAGRRLWGAGGLCGCRGPGFLARGASPYRTGSPGSGKVAAKASTSIFSALSSFWYFSSSSFSLNSFSVALGLMSFCTRSVSSIPAGWGTPGSALPAAAPAASSGSPTLQRLQKVWPAPSCGQMPSPMSRCAAGTRISCLCASPSNWRGRSCPA